MPDYQDGMPARMRGLPMDAHGRPVPWFVAWVNDKPDFRIMDGRKLSLAVSRRLCWACGGALGGFKAFVIGPMCAVNRNTAEPPCHRDCAIYCATHCDFLVNPKRGRRESFMPAGKVDPAGEAIMRNPGVALVWITRGFYPYRDHKGGILFSLAEPIDCLWFAEGRAATRDEVMRSIESGYPFLLELAVQDGPDAVARLSRQKEDAMALIPPA